MLPPGVTGFAALPHKVFGLLYRHCPDVWAKFFFESHARQPSDKLTPVRKTTAFAMKVGRLHSFWESMKQADWMQSHDCRHGVQEVHPSEIVWGWSGSDRSWKGLVERSGMCDN
eukprot:2277927-Amphidinium_carterae.2